MLILKQECDAVTWMDKERHSYHSYQVLLETGLCAVE